MSIEQKLAFASSCSAAFPCQVLRYATRVQIRNLAFIQPEKVVRHDDKGCERRLGNLQAVRRGCQVVSSGLCLSRQGIAK